MKINLLFKAVFKITRSLNLLIICLALFLAKYTIVKPILEIDNVKSSLTDNLYLLMVLSTLFIAAGGYVINDYFDTGIDNINKPGKNIIGSLITKKTSLMVYVLMTFAGLAGAFTFGHISGTRYAGLIFLLCAGLLYFYSASYKKMFLTGNLIISILTSLTIYLSILFDKNALASGPVFTLITAYSVFAFALTLIREIIKDCEDSQGDGAFNANTLPIVAGLKISRWTASILCMITCAAIAYIQIKQLQWEDKISFAYVILFIQAPLLYLAFRNITARNSTDDHRNSTISKIIMVTGLFSMMIFYISF